MAPRRLLHTATLRLADFENYGSPMPAYAILSHRWRKEITFEQIRKAGDDASLQQLNFDASFQASKEKLMKSCNIAQKSGLDYIWADTICIDKSNSEELATALRSMFAYYAEAAVCYAFLDDIREGSGFDRVKRLGETAVEMLPVESPRTAKSSVWFGTCLGDRLTLRQTRGWTLQELVAPRTLHFFDQEWQHLGERTALSSKIQPITGISPAYLGSPAKLREASVAMKMSWMAGRTTGKVEDVAYSLIGLLDISMTPMYGEGIKAFSRLQDILISDYAFDETLFAWESGVELKTLQRSGVWKPREWGLLAPSPDCFAMAGNIVQKMSHARFGGGFTRGYQGISVQLPILETRNRFGGNRSKLSFPLNCANERGTIVLELASEGNGLFKRVGCEKLVADPKAKVGNNRQMGIEQIITTPLTVAHDRL